MSYRFCFWYIILYHFIPFYIVKLVYFTFYYFMPLFSVVFIIFVVLFFLAFYFSASPFLALHFVSTTPSLLEAQLRWWEQWGCRAEAPGPCGVITTGSGITTCAGQHLLSALTEPGFLPCQPYHKAYLFSEVGSAEQGGRFYFLLEASGSTGICQPI